MNNVYPQTLFDIDVNFGSDLSLSPRKDLATSSDLKRSQQRVLRRLLTNPGSYIWHPNYGAGLPRFVGQDLSTDRLAELRSLIISQIFLEESVSRDPEPEIIFQTIIGGLFVQINYVESPSRNPIVLTFNVT